MRKKLSRGAEFKLLMTTMMGRMMLSCREASQLISRAQDERLSFGQRAAIRVHLLFCRWCRLYQKQIHTIRRLIHREPAHRDREPGLSPACREKIKQMLRREI